MDARLMGATYLSFSVAKTTKAELSRVSVEMSCTEAEAMVTDCVL